MVQGFTGASRSTLPLECTYDFEVAAAKYLHALRDGAVPLQFLFSGTVFLAGGRGFVVAQVPWDREASYRMPVQVWRSLMAQHFPGAGWVRLRPRRRWTRCRGTGRRTGCSRSGRGESRSCWPTRSGAMSLAASRRGPSPTRCCTRATCSTRTGRRRRRTRCAGSSACSGPGEARRGGAVGDRPTTCVLMRPGVTATPARRPRAVPAAAAAPGAAPAVPAGSTTSATARRRRDWVHLGRGGGAGGRPSRAPSIVDGARRTCEPCPIDGRPAGGDVEDRRAAGPADRARR